jgi:hypothetical protein
MPIKMFRAVPALLLAMVCTSTLSASAVPATPGPPAYRFINGQWFNGKGFERKQLYAAGGRFSTARPKGVVQTIDLKGQYVVPPFGEAHNHNIEPSPRLATTIASYIRDGIFYVKNPNNLARSRAEFAGRINVPAGIDVTFSNGGLIGLGGHPTDLATRQISRGAWTAADGEGGFYFTIDTAADLERKWPSILAGRPDFIKTYLLYSEEYRKRRADMTYGSWKGLDPKLLVQIVRRAHAAGLGVATHVETAADFRHALAAGVDEINHLPGFRPDRMDFKSYADPSLYRLSDAEARLAARRKVTVVTTISGVLELVAQARPGTDEAAAAPLVRKLLAHNIAVLKRHGVRVAIGSDEYRATAAVEARSLARLGVLDNLTLLKMWSQDTPMAIFPGRKIGKLKNGYEASFLVLPGNPLRDFAATGTISMRMKQGYLLPSAAP